MSIATTLLTAEEFSRLPDPGYPQELVRGVIFDMPLPRARHGQVCGNLIYELKNFCRTNPVGHVLSNDTGVITERDPDTVRGPDAAFVGYGKLPAGPLPSSAYLEIAPDAAFEVMSPSDRWRDMYRKVAEYHSLGVPAVYVLVPETCKIHCYYPDRPEEVLSPTDNLVGIGALTGFCVPVANFFA